jgi:hypothetical protein
MSRIPTPATIEAAPTASRPLLEGVKKQLGVPNMFRLISNSPASLESYLDLSGALNKGALHRSRRANGNTAGRLAAVLTITRP